MLSETGAEGTGKPSWLHYVCNEVREAMSRGVDVRGICWYPITAYPGWDNSRHAETGLLSSIVADGTRHVDERLLAEFEAQREQFEAMFAEKRRSSGNRRGLRLAYGVPTHGQPSCHSMGSMREDPAAVDLVFLGLARAIDVDRVIDDPVIARLVDDDAIVARRDVSHGS